MRIESLQSLLALQCEMFKRGMSFSYIMVSGDPYLAKVRSKIATMFLQDWPQATDLFFLDDDVGFPADAALRLIDCDKDLVAGVYPKKNDKQEWTTELHANRETGLIRDGNLCLAAYAPTGFMRIKRHVLERMAAESGTFADTNAAGRTVECYNIFEMGYHKEDKRWWGEDFAFCRRWVDMGGEVWVDPDIEFTHRGSKVWSGTLADPVANYGASLAPQAEAAE